MISGLLALSVGPAKLSPISRRRRLDPSTAACRPRTPSLHVRRALRTRHCRPARCCVGGAVPRRSAASKRRKSTRWEGDLQWSVEAWSRHQKMICGGGETRLHLYWSWRLPLAGAAASKRPTGARRGHPCVLGVAAPHAHSWCLMECL